MGNTLGFDELHKLASEIYEETKDLPTEKKKEKACEDILDILIFAYLLGWHRVADNGDADEMSLMDAIYLVIEGKTFADRINEHIDNGEWEQAVIERLLETEYHRVEETGAFDSAREYERTTGKTGYKRWITKRDDKVRDTHWYLDGTEVLITGEFITYDGDSARFPGDFKNAENNVNCRCNLEYFFR